MTPHDYSRRFKISAHVALDFIWIDFQTPTYVRSSWLRGAPGMDQLAPTGIYAYVKKKQNFLRKTKFNFIVFIELNDKHNYKVFKKYIYKLFVCAAY